MKVSQKILWIAPNLNHYKVRFLNKLSEDCSFKIDALSGSRISEEGFSDTQERLSFRKIDVSVKKKNFAKKKRTYWVLLSLLRKNHYGIVLMPAERKFFLLILFLACLRLFFRYKLVSYNHPTVGADKKKWTNRSKIWSKLIFSFYNRIIFYTESAMKWAVENKIIRQDNAFYANNTLDIEAIHEIYSSQVSNICNCTILFIGRFVNIKRVDLLIEYFKILKSRLPHLKLIIIGDGPQRNCIEQLICEYDDVKWCGAQSDENEISKQMRNVNLVFVPGASGLSINHAFAYSKPYITVASYLHGPEIDYLQHNTNGLILEGKNIHEDCEQIIALLKNNQRYRTMCENAFNKSKELTLENWLAQFEKALLF